MGPNEPQAPPVLPTQPQNLKFSGTPPWLHYSAMAVSVLAPAAMLLPPRRLDLRSMVLSAGTFFGTNQLAYDYTGRSIHQRFSERIGALSDGGLPEKARENQAKMAAERARLEAALPEEQRRALDEARAKKHEGGALHRLWMGGEKDGWRQRRAEEEKEALEEGGKGIQGLIVDQIWGAWNQATTGKKSGSEKQQEGSGKDGNAKRD